MVTLRCSLQKRFSALITDILGRPSFGCLLTFASTLQATRMVNKLTNGREKQQRKSTPFILVHRKGVVKLIMNFYGSAEGKHPSPWMPCALTELAKQIHQQGLLAIYRDSRIKRSRRQLATDGSRCTGHRKIPTIVKQGCSSLGSTY